jgi:hypothetical protein
VQNHENSIEIYINDLYEISFNAFVEPLVAYLVIKILAHIINYVAAALMPLCYVTRRF